MSDSLWKVSAAKNHVIWGKTDFITSNAHLHDRVSTMKVIRDDSIPRIAIANGEIRYNVDISTLDYRVFRFYLFALLMKHLNKM
jgi:hypothetical protein